MKKRVVKESSEERTGISIDLISTERLEELGKDKIRFILDQVKGGKVLVLEKGLTSSEELELIRVTMSEIDQDSFIGVETPGFTGNVHRRTFFQRLMGRAPPPRMMVVGPAQFFKTIKKDGRTIEALILTREEVMAEREAMEEGQSAEEGRMGRVEEGDGGAQSDEGAEATPSKEE